MRNPRTGLLLMAVVVMTLGRPADVLAQEPCTKAPRGRACRIVVDYLQPVSGRTFSVENETPVTVVLEKKSPFDSCKNEVKREVIPDVSLVPALIGAAVKASASMIVRSPAVTGPGETPPPGFEEALVRLKKTADADRENVDEALRQYDGTIATLRNFYATSYWKDGTPGHDPHAFEKDRAERFDDLRILERVELPNAAASQAIYKKLVADYADQAARPGPAAADLKRRIDEAGASVDALSRTVSVFETARAKVRTTLAYLAGLREAEWEAVFPVRSDRNAKVSGSVGCTSEATGQPTLDPPVVYAVVFGTAPRVALTAGVLVSWVPRNSVGLERIADAHSGPIVTATHEEIVEHPSSPQAVPFSFLHIRLPRGLFYARGHRLTFNGAPGFGVNSNNGNLNAEFFAGVSVGIDSFYVAAGLHAGHKVRPANGYKIGDVPPASLTSVPLETPWAYHISFAVSYRIPPK